MASPKFVAAVGLAFLAMLPPSALSQSPLDVDLGGIVTDPSGKPIAGARLSLTRAKLVAVSDANGRYRLQGSATALRQTRYPLSDPQGVFEVSRFYRFSGSEAWDAAGRNLEVSPAAPARPNPPPGLAKSSADPDTLDVLAMGFQREAIQVAVPSGTRDVKLKALSYTAVAYKPGATTAYEQQRCFLDVHIPPGPAKKWPVLVHLHGGGLQGGDNTEGWSAANKNNSIRKLSEQGYLMICPNYRLGIDPDLPDKGGLRGKWPDYLRDAAAAVAWAKRNAPAYGGDPDNFYVMGYSAGAWLSLMLAIDSAWFKEIGFDGKGVNGYVCFSAQTYTYGEFAIERGISDRGISDGAALKYVHRMDTPIRLFAGGLETQRIADDNDFMKAMNAAGTTNLDFQVMAGRDHEGILATIGNPTDGTRTKMIEFFTEWAKK